MLRSLRATGQFTLAGRDLVAFPRNVLQVHASVARGPSWHSRRRIGANLAAHQIYAPPQREGLRRLCQARVTRSCLLRAGKASEVLGIPQATATPWLRHPATRSGRSVGRFGWAANGSMPEGAYSMRTQRPDGCVRVPRFLPDGGYRQNLCPHAHVAKAARRNRRGRQAHGWRPRSPQTRRTWMFLAQIVAGRVVKALVFRGVSGQPLDSITITANHVPITADHPMYT